MIQPSPSRVLFILLAALLLLAPARSRAQSAIQVNRDEARLEYPTGIRFFITASSQSDIKSVSLLYGADHQTCQPGQALTELRVTPAKQVELDWQLEFVRSGVIPPGVELWWQWKIEDASGQKLLTEKQTVQVNDQRQDWQSLTEELVTLQWYEGDQELYF